jgi:hypothetical protein
MEVPVAVAVATLETLVSLQPVLELWGKDLMAALVEKTQVQVAAAPEALANLHRLPLTLD